MSTNDHPPEQDDRPPEQDRVEHASWLTPEVLVLLVRVKPLAGDSTPTGILIQRGRVMVESRARWLACGEPDGSSQMRTWLVSVVMPQDGAGTSLGSAALRHAGGVHGLLPQRLHSVVCPPRKFGDAGRQMFDGRTRRRMCQFLAAIPAAHGLELSGGLAANLAVLRNQLREPLPGTSFEPGPCVARLERIAAIDQTAFWTAGWIHDAAPRAVRLTAVSPEGEHREVPPDAVTFHPRPQVSARLKDDDTVSTLGYHAYVELGYPSRHVDGWVMEFHTESGRRVEHRLLKPVQTDRDSVWEYMQPRPGADPRSDAAHEHQLLPAIARLRGGTNAAQIEECFDFGAVPIEPDASVVVAVRDAERIQHQLLSFAPDPDFTPAELIFVAYATDHDAIADLAEGLYELYGSPFRLAVLERPARQHRALNVGVSIARGPLLVLMSGDVFPVGGGWLERMRQRYAALPETAVVTPKLLYEDGSIAHAGATYVRRLSGRWERKLPFAGLAADIEGAMHARSVAAASDACLMIATDRFARCEGFSDLYLDGGDESGDLCLRLGDASQVWYEPDAELYLLDELDPRITPSTADIAYNRWLLERRCGGLLAGLASEPAAPAQSPPAPPPVAGPAYDGSPPGPRIQILDLVPAEPDESVMLDGAIVLPGAEDPKSAYDASYALAIEGWAISRDDAPITIELREREELLGRCLANLPSAHISDKHPSVTVAAQSGFQFVVGSLGLPTEFDLGVIAVSADGAATSLGRIRGRRERVHSAYRPQLQPALITTIGRSGSNWLLTLLSQHPEIVALRQPGYEPMLAGYSAEVLRALAEPASYTMALLPEIANERWWLGDGRQTPLPAQRRDPTAARWMGRDNVEMLAAFCQQRLDAFYQALARYQAARRPRYYAEKSPPGRVPQLISELYPEGREIVLVRDFRDMTSSIIDYNTKRGFALWGADSGSDEQWFAYLRELAKSLVDGWRERDQRAQLVRYEDLIEDPAETLARVFSYLGVAADKRTIEEVVSESARAFPDVHESHRTSPSIEASVGRWKRDLSAEHVALCASAFDDLLPEFGYEPTGDSSRLLAGDEERAPQ